MEVRLACGRLRVVPGKDDARPYRTAGFQAEGSTVGKSEATAAWDQGSRRRP